MPCLRPPYIEKRFCLANFCSNLMPGDLDDMGITLPGHRKRLLLNARKAQAIFAEMIAHPNLEQTQQDYKTTLSVDPSPTAVTAQAFESATEVSDLASFSARGWFWKQPAKGALLKTSPKKRMFMLNGMDVSYYEKLDANGAPIAATKKGTFTLQPHFSVRLDGVQLSILTDDRTYELQGETYGKVKLVKTLWLVYLPVFGARAYSCLLFILVLRHSSSPFIFLVTVS